MRTKITGPERSEGVSGVVQASSSSAGASASAGGCGVSVMVSVLPLLGLSVTLEGEGLHRHFPEQEKSGFRRIGGLVHVMHSHPPNT